MYDLKGSKKLLSSTEDRPIYFRGPGGFEAKDLTFESKDVLEAAISGIAYSFFQSH